MAQSKYWGLVAGMQGSLNEFFQDYIKMEQGINDKLSDAEIEALIVPTICQAAELTTRIESFCAYIQRDKSEKK